MDSDKKKLIKLIAHLIELTQKGKLNWGRYDPPSSIVTSYDNKIDFVYTAMFENKNLRIYEEQYKHWYEEDRYLWENQVILDFTDNEGRSIWQFPKLPGLYDLLDAVRYQEAKVDDFISVIIDKIDKE